MVCYNNIKLIHIKNGVNITYNGNETSKETLFSFDSADTFINKFSFCCDIFPEKNNTDILNTKKTIYVNEPSFLYYSCNHQVSFAHYITQTLPKLNVYDGNMKLVIPESTYNNLCKDIIETLNISENDLIILDDEVTYIFSEIYTLPHCGDEWHGSVDNTHGASIFNKVRDKLNIKTNNSPHRKIYLKKDDIQNTTFGNSEVGSNRKIINEPELIKYLVSMGFEIITLGDKTLKEKSFLLRDVNILITQLGANCMNLFLSNGPDNILVLSNDKPIWYEYYVELCSLLNNKKINSEILLYDSIGKSDPKNSTNNPFNVELNDIKKYIVNII